MTDAPIIIPHVGDFVVEKTRYGGHAIQHLSAVKGKIAEYKRYGTHVGRVRLEDIVFAGTESAAKRLHELLDSSRALQSDECRKSMERRALRDQEYIAKAKL